MSSGEVFDKIGKTSEVSKIVNTNQKDVKK